jgi:ABC-type nitrate/sulfonate/bicarbonate transport system permease component
MLVASLGATLALWQAASTFGFVDRALFPPPTEVLQTFVDLALNRGLSSDIEASATRAFAGLLIGGISGFLLGLVTGRVRMVDGSLSPMLHFFRSLPPVALVPLVIVWLGIGETARVFSISCAVLFPVWVNTHAGSFAIPARYLQASSTLTASRLKVWRRVIVPSSLPYAVTGIRTGIGVAFIMVFVSELLGLQTVWGTSCRSPR